MHVFSFILFSPFHLGGDSILDGQSKTKREKGHTTILANIHNDFRPRSFLQAKVSFRHGVREIQE